MTLATNRPDGWPQATVVGYANDGLTIYCFVARLSQKYANIVRDPRVSAAIASDFLRPERHQGTFACRKGGYRHRRGRIRPRLRHLHEALSRIRELGLGQIPPSRHDSHHADRHLGARLLQGIRSQRSRQDRRRRPKSRCSPNGTAGLAARSDRPRAASHMTVKLTFLGGVGTVTGSKYLVEVRRPPYPGRLRTVPGLQAAAPAQLGEVSGRSREHRRRAAYACPHRPFRLLAAAGRETGFAGR